MQDLRFALRTLLKNPGFTAATVLTLALATGATTAIFSIVDSVLLRPLPFRSPERLVQVFEIWPVGGAGAVVYQDVESFRREAGSFEGFAGYGLTTRHLDGTNGTERLTAVMTDRDFFAVLGAEPIAGRTFRGDDQGQLAVISARLWSRRFGRDPSVIGRTLALGGNVFDAALQRTVIQRREFTVLGVMSDAFQFPYAAGSVYPTALPESQTDIWIFDDSQRREGRFSVTARLKAGVSIEAANAELTVIEARMDQIAPQGQGPGRATGVQLEPLAETVLGSVGRSLWLLFGAVGLVLATACANVANLLLARATARTREVVTRAALGAGRGRLVRQFLTESVVLSLAGGLIGAAVAWWGTRILIAMGSAKIPRAHEVVLDWRAFAFLFLVCLATAALFGLAPALSAARADIPSVTKDAAGHATMGRGFSRMRDALIVAEVALAFVLAVGAAAVMRELTRLHAIDAGIVTDNVVTFHLTPRVDDSEYYRIEERVARLPGVDAAGLIHMVPLQNWGGIGTFQVRGRPPEEPARMPTAELRSVTPGYFQVLGIPIRAGRGVTERDSVTTPTPILINDALARLYFAGEDPMGRELNRGTIVGVVGDVRHAGLDRPAFPQIYSPVNRSAGIASDIGMSLLVRAQGSPDALVAAVRGVVREVNPNLAIFNIKTMEQIVSDSLWELKLYRWLIGLFAALALLLAAIGLYGVIAYSVTTRVREFAVRLALGSDPISLGRLVMARGVGLASAGLLIGALTAVALARMLRELPATFAPDPVVFAAISGLVLAIALLACLVPALRVTRVDPATALRHE